METGGYTALWLLGDPAACTQRNTVERTTGLPNHVGAAAGSGHCAGTRGHTTSGPPRLGSRETWLPATPDRPRAVVMHHESFMRWLCAAQSAIAVPETFTCPVAWCARAVATTSQAGRSFAEALDRAVEMIGIFNRELQDRNAPETSR